MGSLGEHHRALLERFRRSMNLVGPGPIEVHFEDSTLALAGLQPEGHWVDLGSGAGFPGLVLADLHPTLRIDLVDSRSKRCVFLDQVLAAAGNDTVQVRNQRVETLPDTGYDGVVARAFAPPPRLVEHARRLLRPDGQLVLFLQADADVPAADGFVEERTTHYTVDGKQRKSVVLRLQRVPPG